MRLASIWRCIAMAIWPRRFRWLRPVPSSTGGPQNGLARPCRVLSKLVHRSILWTPALSPGNEDLPHGMIFATFMLSSMIGSSIASRLLLRTDTRPEVFMQRVFGIAAAALAVPVLVMIGRESLPAGLADEELLVEAESLATAAMRV